MINEKVFIKLPLLFKGKIEIFPPSVSDVILDDNFHIYRKILVLTQEDIEDEYIKNGIEESIPTPLQYILKHSYEQQFFSFMVRKAFYFFTKQNVKLMPEEEKIKIKLNDEIFYINEENFFDFQNLVRESLGEKIVEKPDPNEHPRIKKMKAKARYRDRIKAKKGDGLTLSSSLAVICCMGIGLNPLNIGNISYAAVNVLIEVYQNKEKYHLDIESLLAGSNKVKPEYWIKNLE